MCSVNLQYCISSLRLLLVRIHYWLRLSFSKTLDVRHKIFDSVSEARTGLVRVNLINAVVGITFCCTGQR